MGRVLPATSTARAVVDTERELESGTDLVLVIDVQGARQVRRHRRSSVIVFVMPPSFEVLEARLRGRSEDTRGGQVRRRLEVARGEVAPSAEYDYVVVNDDGRRLRRRLRAIVARRAVAARTLMGRDVGRHRQASFEPTAADRREAPHAGRKE